MDSKTNIRLAGIKGTRYGCELCTNIDFIGMSFGSDSRNRCRVCVTEFKDKYWH